MSIIYDIKKRAFEGIWNGSKTFYVANLQLDKEIILNHVISFRERTEDTRVLTGREMHANIKAVDPVGSWQVVIGFSIYQRIDFREKPDSKRKV